MGRLINKVWIVGGQIPVEQMFRMRGYDVINDFSARTSPFDLIVFCGGEDINPTLYGEDKHFRTQTNPARDVKEHRIFLEHQEIPKVGICRGGQLLNVLNNGSMWQHVEGHQSPHEITDLLFTKKEIRVSSVHHQVMIPARQDSFVLAVSKNVGLKHQSCRKENKPIASQYDPEVIWYPRTNSLCYQPHPEWHTMSVNTKTHQDYFFDLVNWSFER